MNQAAADMRRYELIHSHMRAGESIGFPAASDEDAITEAGRWLHGARIVTLTDVTERYGSSGQTRRVPLPDGEQS